jgi:hypothetical protein
MSEPEIKKEAEEFSDELSDEALDRTEGESMTLLSVRSSGIDR